MKWRTCHLSSSSKLGKLQLPADDQSTPQELQLNTTLIPNHHPLRNSANARTVPHTEDTAPHLRGHPLNLHATGPKPITDQNFPPLSPPAHTTLSLFLLEWWHPQHQDWPLAPSSVKEQIFPHQKATSKQVSVTQYTDKTYPVQVNRNLTFLYVQHTIFYWRH